MPDIVFYEIYAEEKAALAKRLERRWRVQYFSQTVQELTHHTPPAGLISIRTQSRIPDGWAPNLRGVLTRSTGYDHLQAFLRRTNAPIPCGYLSPYCSRAVAEQAMLLMLALFRKLSLQQRSMQRFCRDGLSGHEVLGKNCLVIGVGHIGSEVVRLARGMGMRVKGVDIVQRFRGLDYVSLTTGISWADAVICCCPLTSATTGMIREEVFRQSRRTPVLVNIARGEITPVKDLLRLLKKGRLAGIALDVFPDESSWAPFVRMGRRHRKSGDLDELARLQPSHNVIFTPHNAFNTVEATGRKADYTAAAIRYFFKHSRFPAQVT